MVMLACLQNVEEVEGSELGGQHSPHTSEIQL